MYTIGLLMQQIIYASESRKYDSEPEDECSPGSDRASVTETSAENPPTETKERVAMTYFDLAVELYCYKAAETGMSDDAIGLYKKGVLEAKNGDDFSSILEALRNSLGQVEGSKVFRAIEYTVANYANDAEKLQCITSVIENAEKIERPETICELLKIGICDANTEEDFLDVYEKLVTTLGPVNGVNALRVINYVIAYYTKEDTKIENMLAALRKAKETDATETTLKLFKSKICEASDDKTKFKKLLSIMIDKIDFVNGGFVFEAINAAICDYEEKYIDLLKKIHKTFVNLKRTNDVGGLLEIFDSYSENFMDLDHLYFMITDNLYFWNRKYTFDILGVINFITSDKKEDNMKELLTDLLKAENSKKTKFCYSDLTAEEFFVEFISFLDNNFYYRELLDDSDKTTKMRLIWLHLAIDLKISGCGECKVGDTKTVRNKLQMLSAIEKEYKVILNFIDFNVKKIKEAVSDSSKRESEEILAFAKSKSCEKGEGLTLEEEKTMSFGCGESSGSIFNAGVLKYGFAALSVGVGLYKWFY